MTLVFPEFFVRSGGKLACLLCLLAITCSVMAAELPQSESELASLAQDVNQPNPLRSAALAELRSYPGPNALIAIARGAQSEHADVRLGAIQGAEGLAAKYRLEIALPLSADPSPEVRREVARVLSPLWSRLSPEDQQQLQGAVADYQRSLEQLPPSAAAYTQHADLQRSLENYAQAESLYMQAIAIDDKSVAAYLNLAELYRLQQQEHQALETLTLATVTIPSSADAHYSLALALFRQSQSAEATKHLQQAYELAPSNSRFAFVYGVSVKQSQPELATRLLTEAYRSSGDPKQLFALCDHLLEQPKQAHAEACIQELSQIAPKDVVDDLRQRLTRQ